MADSSSTECSQGAERRAYVPGTPTGPMHRAGLTGAGCAFVGEGFVPLRLLRGRCVLNALSLT